MDSSGGTTVSIWTETVEDLVHSGEIDQAISFLESLISNLENELEKEQLQCRYGGKSRFPIADQLYTALQDLSKLYAAQGFSLRTDQTQSRALQIKHRKGGLEIGIGLSSNEFIAEAGVSKNEAITSDGTAKRGHDGSSSNSHIDGTLGSGEDDDWEAMADRDPEELLSSQSLSGISKLSFEDSKAQISTKRRGRGTFSYKKKGLYSDYQSDEPVIDDTESDSVSHDEDSEKRNINSRHVLVLADFPPSTRATDLEKMLEKFKDLFVIRWVNDTTALAIFRTPSVALEASKSVRCPFTVRVLNEDDELLSSIPRKDLEPLRQRPQTSARTAQRLIAHSMGIKLPSTFGSSELRKQEEERKNRIVSRQEMRNDVWGDDDTN